MNHNIRIRFLIAFVGIFIVVFGNHNKADAYGECSQYGHMATYDYLSDSCKCMSGYVFKDNYYPVADQNNNNTFAIRADDEDNILVRKYIEDLLFLNF